MSAAAKTWRTLVPDALHEFWNKVSAGPRQCHKGAGKDTNKDKNKDGVGHEIGLIYGCLLYTSDAADES